jgi:hypothetical protein
MLLFTPKITENPVGGAQGFVKGLLFRLGSPKDAVFFHQLKLSGYALTGVTEIEEKISRCLDHGPDIIPVFMNHWYWLHLNICVRILFFISSGVEEKDLTAWVKRIDDETSIQKRSHGSNPL